MSLRTPFCLLFLLPFVLFSCDNSDDLQGLETRVYGRVYDPLNNVPAENFTIRIIESTEGVLNLRYIDSTITDSQGYYDFSFKHRGEGYYYRIDMARTVDKFLGFIYSFEEFGVDHEVNIDFLQHYPVTLNITTAEDVEYLPIRMHSYHSGWQIPAITETGLTILNIYVDRFSDFDLSFLRNKNDDIEKHRITVPATNTTEPTEINLEINDDDFSQSW